MKNIRIYYRFLTILLLAATICLMLLTSLYLINSKQQKLIYHESQTQFENEVNSLIKLKTSSLKQVVYDYTYWNEFIDNIQTVDTTWYQNNIATILTSFHFDYVCVYDTLNNLVYEASSEGFSLQGIDLKDALVKLNETRFLDFFQVTPGGLIEISGGTIHPDNDPTHMLTRPSGSILLAKSWNKEFLYDLSILSNAEIYSSSLPDSIQNAEQYTISVIQELHGWDGKEVADIVFTRSLNSLKLHNRMSFFMILILLGSVLTIWLLFHINIRKWIIKPLRLVTRILKSDNQALIGELKNCGGEFTAIGNLFNDYIVQKNELVISKEKAEESDRLKSAFLANMSHEIRTPMNGILGFADLLKEPGLSGDQQKEYIRIIEKSGLRMLNIINDIIDISKLEAGLMKPDIREAKINEQIEYIYTFFKPEAEAKGIRFSFNISLPDHQAIIMTDREKLYAILTNLIKNAIKYIKEGAIEFGYHLKRQNEAAELEFYVKDTGIGIPKDRQEAIFERFIQADIEDRMAYQGTGLGLAITKAYVEMLGGRIWVESEEGNGSIFYFTLPYSAEPQEKIVVENFVSLQEEKNQIRKLKILVVEDDEVSEMLIAIDVEKFSKNILKAGTGNEAVEIIRNNPDIDLILMDIQMPELMGYEATRQIRQFNQEVIIIVQTAFGLYGDREKAIEAGCNDYISKPINKEELLGLIQKYFGK
ncbi:MAG: hypothetical protein FD155_2715 [Bacteroidetes bacterium]|nr:MAG: hypothetical protein FD155_2715 [Bacteroidota bacterium]